MRKNKQIIIIMCTGLWLFIVLLTSSADLRTKKDAEKDVYIKYLQNEFDSCWKQRLYKFELLNGYVMPIKTEQSAYIKAFYDAWHNGKLHKSIDFGRYHAKITPISPMAPGYVLRTYNSKTMGKTVEIIHHDLSITVYQHLSRITVKKYDCVDTDTTIGIMGNTGGFSEGWHLHVYALVKVLGKYQRFNFVKEKDKSEWWK